MKRLKKADNASSPKIGILTVRGKSGFRGDRKNYIDLIRTGKKMGVLVYVVTCEDIDFEIQAVTGYLYDVKRKQWLKKMMPIPDVFYNRIPYRHFEQRSDVKKVLHSIASSPHIHMFNQRFFDKWGLYQMMQQHPDLSRILPETRLLTSKHVLYQMIKTYPTVYLKPVEGKAGKGILRITGRSDGYQASRQQNQRMIHRTFKQLDALWRYIHSHISNQTYLIQQGIDLVKYRNAPFDIRVLAQKNGKGSWEISGIGARVAGQDRITTHVPRGGKIASPGVVLRDNFSKDRTASLLAKISNRALKIAEHLEHSTGLMGETSMDIGIDRKGNLWFFEANAKPMKFDEPHIRKKSLQNIIAYCLFLSGSQRS